MEIFSGTGQNVQCHQNRTVTMTTWSNLCGAGQIDRHHFSIIKSRVYSAFWGFRYVRMYRFCTHVHSKKAKSSHIQDFGCSHAGNSQVSCSIRNASKGVGDSPPPRWQGKSVMKHDSLNNVSAACDQIGHSQFKGVTNGYTLWSLSLNTYHRITGPRMGEQAQAGPGLQFPDSPTRGGLPS